LLLGLLEAATTSSIAGRSADDIAALRVVSGLSFPVFVTAPAGDARLFLVEQGGLIRVIEDGNLLSTPFLDVSSLVACCGERGLLGLAFAPDYAASGVFYVNFTASDSYPEPGIALGTSVIARYQVSANPNVANAGSREELLTIAQPFANHNGGTLAFGPGGMLWISTGDGGGGGDPEENAQNTTTLLGKMLRIDVSAGPGSPYTIPPDNPFAETASNRGEIWAYGLRNPFRFSFDREEGDLYVADVGQSAWEEINVEPAGDMGGRNYGWDCKEGTHDFEFTPDCASKTFTEPVHEYAHAAGPCSGSVTGGYVYRGQEIPALRGRYFFADFCQQKIWTFVWDGAGGVVDLQERTAELTPGDGTIGGIAGFGEDGFGELYIVDRGTGSNGEVFKIVPTQLLFFRGNDEDGPPTNPRSVIGAAPSES
jgi:hypothetical protein